MAEYALRLQNSTDTAPRVRKGDALHLQHNGTATGTRSGLRPDGGGNVTANAGAMSVTVQPFTAWVNGGSSTLQGGYIVVLDTAKSLTIADGHASLARVDVIAAVVNEDAFDASGTTAATVKVIQGTPGSGVPALPATATALRVVNVPAGKSAGNGGLTSTNIGTDRRVWTAAAGGVLRVAGQTERDALGALSGQAVYRLDTNKLEVYNGAGWDSYLPDQTTAWATPVMQNGAVQGTPPVQYRKAASGIVMVYGTLASAKDTQTAFTLPVGFRPAVATVFAAVGSGWDLVAVTINADGTVVANGQAEAGGTTVSAIPFSFTFPTS